MRPKFQRLLILATIILCMFAAHDAKGQSVQIREHKKVPLTRKATIKIINQNGFTYKGKWQMETAEALSIRLSSGREIIVPKSDIAELYQCETLTNEGFFYGFLIGTVTSVVVIYFMRTDDAGDFLAAPLIGSFCGLVGAVYGSLRESCEPYYFDDVPPGITDVGGSGDRRLGFNLGFRF